SEWQSLTMPSRSGYFLFAHFWIHEDEVHRQCHRSMNIHDTLTVIVRSAIHESDFYTEPEAARLLVKFYGAKAAARLILEGQQDVSLRCILAHFFGLPSSHFSEVSNEGRCSPSKAPL